MVTEKKPAAPAASDKTASAKASPSVTDKASLDKASLDKASLEKASPNKPAAKSAKASEKGAGKQTPVNTPPKKSLPWFKIILLLLLIAALAASAWFGWMQWQQRTILEDQIQRGLATLDAKVERQQQAMSNAGQGQSREIDQLQKQLYSLRLVTNRQAEQILILGSATRGDWLLAEAAYLVRLANQRLQVERSVDNPLAILETVDNIFVQLNDPELLAVRNALAVDIAALRMTEKVDREGIYLELQAISSALETLAILESHADPEALLAAQPAQAVGSAKQAPSSLAETLERFTEKFGNLIVLQKREQPIEPLLSGAEQTMVRQNLYLLLEQAQSALLREEQSIYSSNLSKAEMLLRRYFQLNSESEATIARLQSLTDQSVSQTVPDISGSQSAIQTALNLRQNSSADEGPEQ